MRNALLKCLLIAVAPAMALTQEPPTPPTPPTPPARVTPPRAARPAWPVAPAEPVLPPLDVRPLFDYDFDFNLDFAPNLDAVRSSIDALRSEQVQRALDAATRVRIDVQPQVQIAMEDARRELLQRSRETDLEMQRADREMQRAQMLAQREMERSQLDIQREVERAQREVQRSFNYGSSFSEDRFNNARPRQGWAKEDPADSLYRAARESLNRGEYRRAAQMFSDVVRKYPKSQYSLDCQYWEAFSRYRAGTTDDLRQAQKLLEDPKMAAVRSNEYNMDVSGLRARIYGALAARGDADAARKLQTEASQNTSCDREEVSVRAEALSALGQMDLASAMPVVKKVLARRDDCTIELRRRALYLLGRQPNSESVPLMLDVAKNDSDQGIRREAMSWLSRTAGDQAVPMLEDLLRTSNDEQTQRSAVQALGSIDTDKARKAVRAIIERTDALERVRAEAISTLVRDRDNRLMAADDQTYLRSLYAKVETQRLKESVLSAVSRIEAPENEAWLLGIAKNENEIPSLRAQALQRLGRMTTVSFDEIGKLYENADSRELRQQILRALSERKEPNAVDKLVEVAKKDTDPNIRRYAIQILSRSNNPKALQGIKELADKP